MNGKLKKTICAVALAGAVGMLAGCAAPAADTAANSVASGSQTPASAAPVSVTFPKSYFIDAKTSDDATAMLQQLGCTDIAAGSDGSYTAKLAGDAYQKLVSDQRAMSVQTIDAMKGSKTYAHIQDVSYDDNLTWVKIALNTDTPGLEDTYAPAVAGVAATQYQTIAGKAVGCSVTVTGASGAQLSSANYPQ